MIGAKTGHGERAARNLTSVAYSAASAACRARRGERGADRAARSIDVPYAEIFRR